MCYTSGTTGRPKAVLYSHRSTVLHSLACGLWDCELVRERDVVLPVVPMFHANAWGLPFTCLLLGASQVLPGPYVDAESLLGLMAAERVTVASGVPTVWLAVLQALDASPAAYDLSNLRALFSGGASVPESLIRAFEERHGLTVIQGWGMTETSPVATLATLSGELAAADSATRFRVRATAGRPLPFVETRVRADAGIAPRDGATMGELEIRGPWVAQWLLWRADESAARFTDDGWFRTGDIVTMDAAGYVTIRDRAKDVIKSGGRMDQLRCPRECLDEASGRRRSGGHRTGAPKVGRAPACAHRASARGTVPGGRARRSPCAGFAKFWIPSAFEIVPAIPRTSVGKVNKLALRAQYRDYFMPAQALAAIAASPASPLTS